MASSIHLSFLVILLLQQFVSVTSRCAVNYSVECNQHGVHSATSILTFRVTDENDGAGVDSEYEAEVTFHWDAADDTKFGSRTYITGEQQEVRSTQFLPKDGYYNVGYTLTFGEGSGVGCEGKSFEKYFLVQYEDNYCSMKSADPTPAATEKITDEPTTDEPTPSTITYDPTPSPSSIQPLTGKPIEKITDEPTTDEPTPSTITYDPTPSPSSIQPLTGKPINGKANTASPTPEVEVSGGTPTALPSFTPTKFPTISTQQRTTALPNSNVVCLTEEELEARVEAVCGAEPRVTESPNLSVTKSVPLITAQNSSGKTTLGASIAILGLVSVSLMLF